MTANTRYKWVQLPRSVQQAIEDRLGAAVVSASERSGGFTAGMASVLATGSSSVFVKALPVHEGQTESYRREAVFSRALPVGVPAPKLHFDFEIDGWKVLAFEAVEGNTLSARPSQSEVEEVVRLIDAMRAVLTPPPVKGLPTLSGRVQFEHWQTLAGRGRSGKLSVEDLPAGVKPILERFADAEAHFAYVRGESMLHLDVRHDNLIRRRSDGKILLVDWSWPAVGPSWLDAASYIATCEGDFDPEAALEVHGEVATTNRADIDSFIVGLTGHWLAQSHEPAPPNAPHLREYQSASATNALRWLDRRGWGIDVPLLSL